MIKYFKYWIVCYYNYFFNRSKFYNDKPLSNKELNEAGKTLSDAIGGYGISTEQAVSIAIALSKSPEKPKYKRSTFSEKLEAKMEEAKQRHDNK